MIWMGWDGMWLFCIFSMINKLYTLIWHAIVIIMNDGDSGGGGGGGGSMQIRNWCLLIDKTITDFNGFFFLSASYFRTWSTRYCYSRFICISILLHSDFYVIVCVFFFFDSIIIIIIIMIVNVISKNPKQIQIYCNLSMCYVNINNWHEWECHSKNNGNHHIGNGLTNK